MRAGSQNRIHVRLIEEVDCDRYGAHRDPRARGGKSKAAHWLVRWRRHEPSPLLGDQDEFARRLEGLFRRGIPSQPEDIILLSLGDTSSTLAEHLSSDCYRWNEPKEIKTFECLILAKFLHDHALERTYQGKLTPDEPKLLSTLDSNGF